MRRREFDDFINAIRKGSVKVPAIELEDGSSHSNVFEGSYYGQKVIEHNEYSLTYYVAANQSCSIRWGRFGELDDYDCNELTVETEVMYMCDEDGNEESLTVNQKEKIESLLNEYTQKVN